MLASKSKRIIAAVILVAVGMYVLVDFGRYLLRSEPDPKLGAWTVISDKEITITSRRPLSIRCWSDDPYSRTTQKERLGVYFGPVRGIRNGRVLNVVGRVIAEDGSVVRKIEYNDEMKAKWARYSTVELGEYKKKGIDLSSRGRRWRVDESQELIDDLRKGKWMVDVSLLGGLIPKNTFEVVPTMVHSKTWEIGRIYLPGLEHALTYIDCSDS